MADCGQGRRRKGEAEASTRDRRDCDWRGGLFGRCEPAGRARRRACRARYAHAAGPREVLHARHGCRGEEPVNINDIPQFPKSGYQVDVPWRDLPETVRRHVERDGLDLEPDFQRGHVWTEEQRIRYVEYVLRGGEGG